MDEQLKSLWSLLTSLLSHSPSDKPHDYWSDGDIILCPSVEEANVLADILEAAGLDTVTGYYDPAEDDASGSRDKYTGYAYVDIN